MYSPKLTPDLVARLHSICQELGIPMTQFVNEVVGQALVREELRLVAEGKDSVLWSIGVERTGEDGHGGGSRDGPPVACKGTGVCVRR